MAKLYGSFALLLYFETVLLFALRARSFSFPMFDRAATAREERRTSRRRSAVRSGNDDDVANEPDATTRVVRAVLDAFKDSSFVAAKHAEHVASPTVVHLLKGTPLADAPDEAKAAFADSWAGRAVAAIVAEEQTHLGAWKIDRVVEAAGDYDEEEVAASIARTVASRRVVAYSFVDCPWCVSAENVLVENYPSSSFEIVHLETLGRTGKAVRAELARRTGRTSMPCVFVDGTPVGGFTDGHPCGPGLRALHESGELAKLILTVSTNETSSRA